MGSVDNKKNCGVITAISARILFKGVLADGGCLVISHLVATARDGEVRKLCSSSALCTSLYGTIFGTWTGFHVYGRGRRAYVSRQYPIELRVYRCGRSRAF